MKKFIIIILLITNCLSCSKQTNDINKALALSGDNRIELEKVLNHYKGDSLKYRAAIYLIENMPGHYSYDGDYMIDYMQNLREQNPQLSFVHYEIFSSLPNLYSDNIPNIAKIEDIRVISADYLISHIDFKFKLWEAAPWKNQINFETFCEYILPYRNDIEPLSAIPLDSLIAYYEKLREYSGLLKYSKPTIFNFKNEIVKNTRLFGVSPQYTKLLPPINDYRTDCLVHAYSTQSKLKLFCIPSAIDYTPQWHSRSGLHYWNIIFDPEVYQSLLNENREYKPAKVYRKTYSHNPYPYDDYNYVPLVFQTPFNKDVTEQYITCKNIKLPIHAKNDVNYAYLSVFDNKTWQPIAWGNVSKNHAVFNKMGVNTLYQLIYYDKEKLTNYDYPFILRQDGLIARLVPDKSNTISMQLYRKYPINDSKIEWLASVDGLYVEAGNSPDFDDATIVGQIDGVCAAIEFIIKLNIKSKYRFWRIKSKNRYAGIAELFFRDSINQTITGQAIIENANKEVRKSFEVLDPLQIEYSAFDGNILSYTYLQKWIGMDMGKSVSVSEIVVIPKNDDNFIRPGDLYEMFYHNDAQWISLGQKIAENFYLNYDNVPSGALYILRNLTKGSEERPFTYENGQVTFW